MGSKPAPHIKIDLDSGGNLRARLDKSKGLNRKERDELVDLMRKNLFYQTPKPVFRELGDDHPTWVDLRFVFQHHQRILILLNKAGGWTMPKDEKQKLLQQHEEAARKAHGDGTDYDFEHLSYGDLVAMHTELEGIDEMALFRDAIAAEISEYQKGESNG